jgi:hypothetical protein
VFRNIDQLDDEMEGGFSAPFKTFIAAAKRAKFDVDIKGGSTHFVPTVSSRSGAGCRRVAPKRSSRAAQPCRHPLASPSPPAPSTPAPQDAAFAAAGITPETVATTSPAELRRVLQYHTIPGYHAIPAGFINSTGKPIATALPGSTLTVATTVANRTGSATVTDEAGNTAAVLAPNFFLMGTTLHGIDKVLSPKAGAAAGAAAATAPTTPTTRPTGAVAPRPVGARPAGAAAATAPAATAATAPAAGATMPAGNRRHLLQRGSSGETQVSELLGTLNAQDAVRASVSSSGLHPGVSPRFDRVLTGGWTVPQAARASRGEDLEAGGGSRASACPAPVLRTPPPSPLSLAPSPPPRRS